MISEIEKKGGRVSELSDTIGRYRGGSRVVARRRERLRWAGGTTETRLWL